jgi:putative SOS response-associated peptidase YedK
MCGRFVRSSSLRQICEHFDVQHPSFEVELSYNIAPSQNILIINNPGAKQVANCKWGFMPCWAKDVSVGYKMINARLESVTEKPAFRTAFRKHRCLVIANGFYEWQKDMKRKIPAYIRLKSGALFGFAGLYNAWTSPDGEKVCTCTILTTESNKLLSAIHDRMPVIVPSDKEDLWIAPEVEDAELLKGCLSPFPSEEMVLTRVSDRVNSPVYDSLENIKPFYGENGCLSEYHGG